MARKFEKSFYEWCIENDRQDILDLWDYELNKCSPKEIAYMTKKKYYFKCPIGLHKSELKTICNIVTGNTNFVCNQCNLYSFEEWCIDNKHEDWLKLWDYELNECTPREIKYSTHKKYYFKCFRGIHKSELKKISDLTNKNYNLKCNQCESFGQFLIDEFGENALELYWDYELNTENPFNISKNSHKTIWIKCQEKEYHGSYKTMCFHFFKGARCPYCCCFHGKVHPKDSLGQKLIDDYGEDAIERYWSKKNKVNPFEVALYSRRKIWIKCQNNEEHEDYEITCVNFTRNQRCPVCKESKGERKIREILNTYDISFIPQKTFSNLLGVNNGRLSYDFYLPEQNLLIEYQGQYHDGTARYSNETQEEHDKRFKIQQEHDKRKREYAEQKEIKLLEIWYWDFDNITKILNKELGLS